MMPKRPSKKRSVKPQPGPKARTRHREHEEERERSRDLKRQFRDAHSRGEDALKAHDYDRLGTIIREEGQIIEAHQQLISKAEQRANARLEKITAKKDRTKS